MSSYIIYAHIFFAIYLHSGFLNRVVKKTRLVEYRFYKFKAIFSFANMDKDIISLFISCIHHKNVENKEDLLKEVLRVGITEHILKLVGVRFEERTMNDLETLIRDWQPPRTFLYAGGTSRENPQAREREHERRFEKMISFFYCPVDNVKTSESRLLELGTNKLKYNKQVKSNCDPKPGYVYVLDTGLDK